MGYADKTMKRDAKGMVVPQVWNPALDNGVGDWEVLEGAGGTYKSQAVQRVAADYLSGTGNLTKVFDEDMHGVSFFNNGNSDITFTVNGIARPVFAQSSYEQIFKEAFRSISINGGGPWHVDIIQLLGSSIAAPIPEPPDTTAPDNVTNLRASDVNQNSATLTWDASASTDTVGYEIWRAGVLLTTVTGLVYNATGMTASTQYTYTVKAKDAAGNVASGTSVNVTTTAQPSDDIPPDNVTGLSVGNITQTEVALTWHASASSDIKDYRVYNGLTLIATVTGLSYDVTGLAADTDYTFTVKARDASDNEASGSTVSVRTLAQGDTTAPEPVTNLTAGAPTQTTIPVTWTDSASTDVIGFEVAYSADGTNYTIVTGSVGPNETSYTVTGLSEDTAYTIRVIAYDAAGNRSIPATVQATTAAPDVVAPDPVTGLTTGTTTETTIPLSWTLSASGDVVSQEVAYSTDGTNFTVASDAVNNSSTSYTVTGLTAETSYTLRVVAVDGAGNRSADTTVQATTAAGQQGGEIIFADDFNRPDSTTGLGGTWEPTDAAKIMGIINNTAYTPEAKANVTYLQDTGHSDAIEITLDAIEDNPAGPSDYGIVFRYVSDSSYLKLIKYGTIGSNDDLRLQKKEGTLLSNIKVGIADFSIPYGLKVRLEGDRVICMHGDTVVIDQVVDFNLSATKHGIVIHNSADVRVDNFEVKTI